MSTMLLIHGPNLNLLGARDRTVYGEKTLADIESSTKSEAKKVGHDLRVFQSNHEGAIIDYIQKESPAAVGIIINPGALTHYSYAIHDALVDSKLPSVEVHLSDVDAREPWREISVTAPASVAKISGKGEARYIEALQLLHKTLSKRCQLN